MTRSDWDNRLLNAQLQQYIIANSTCEQCGHRYTSVEDFREKDPRRGMEKREITFVCKSCWPAYEIARRFV